MWKSKKEEEEEEERLLEGCRGTEVDTTQEKWKEQKSDKVRLGWDGTWSRQQ